LLGQRWYRKRGQYRYRVELPAGFAKVGATFQTVDIKAADKLGNSVLVNIKVLPAGSTQASLAREMNSMSNEDIEQSFAESSGTARLLKRGVSTTLPGTPYYIHYIGTGLYDNVALYHMMYVYVSHDRLYLLHASCPPKDIDLLGPKFMRFFKSFRYLG
jgi:hypothetical protein